MWGRYLGADVAIIELIIGNEKELVLTCFHSFYEYSCISIKGTVCFTWRCLLRVKCTHNKDSAHQRCSRHHRKRFSKQQLVSLFIPTLVPLTSNKAVGFPATIWKKFLTINGNTARQTSFERYEQPFFRTKQSECARSVGSLPYTPHPPHSHCEWVRAWYSTSFSPLLSPINTSQKIQPTKIERKKEWSDAYSWMNPYWSLLKGLQNTGTSLVPTM